MTALVAALLAGLTAWLTPTAAYAFTEHRDGTITITFHDLTDARALNRDLRAHGANRVRAIGVNDLPACPPTTKSGLNDPAAAPWGALWTSGNQEPVGYFFYEIHIPDRRVATLTRNALTIDLAKIPPSKVLIVVVMDKLAHQSQQAYAEPYLLAAPGPTCMVGGHQS